MLEVFNLPTKEQFDTMNSHLANISVPTATSITIADAGNIITATNVEGALQEDRVQINALVPLVGVGGVVESGSNANGYYVKYADGTMICTFKSTTMTTSALIVSDVYVSNAISWAYPAAFLTAPIVSFGAISAYAIIGFRAGEVSTTGANYITAYATTASATCNLMLTAIGRWK